MGKSKTYKKLVKTILKDIRKKVRHKAKVLSKQDVEDNRSSAYKYLDL